MSPGSSGSTVAMSSACCPGRAVPRDPRAGWRRAGPARGGRCAVDEFLDRNVETATDALRLAVALSGGDVSLTTATTRFAPMKRGVRRLLLRLLDRAPNAVEDVMRHAERWKRLAEVHPGDYADKYPRALAAITAARRDDAPASFGSRVETLLAQRHIATLTPLLQQRPGEFARRLDVTLRRSTDPDAVLDAFETVAAQASTPILLQVLAQTRAPRPCPASLHAQGALAKVYGIPDRREPLAPEVLARAAESAKTRSSSASRHCRWAAASSTRAARPSCRWRSAPHRSHCARWCAAVACRCRTRASSACSCGGRTAARARTSTCPPLSSTPISCSCRRSRTTT